MLKIQNHLYKNTLTLYQHSFTKMRGHALYRDKQMTYVSIERKIYMKLTFPSTRSKIGSRIIGVMTIIKRFRTLKTRLRMFRQPFLDGRRSDRVDAMTVYRDTLWYLTSVYIHWKKPAICLPSHGICLYYFCFLIFEEDENYQLLFKGSWKCRQHD